MRFHDVPRITTLSRGSWHKGWVRGERLSSYSGASAIILFHNAESSARPSSASRRQTPAFPLSFSMMYMVFLLLHFVLLNTVNVRVANTHLPKIFQSDLFLASNCSKFQGLIVCVACHLFRCSIHRHRCRRSQSKLLNRVWKDEKGTPQ